MCLYCQDSGLSIKEDLYNSHNRKFLVEEREKFFLLDGRGRRRIRIGREPISKLESLYLAGVDKNGEGALCSVPINYCPICGRQLNDKIFSDEKIEQMIDSISLDH